MMNLNGYSIERGEGGTGGTDNLQGGGATRILGTSVLQPHHFVTQLSNVWIALWRFWFLSVYTSHFFWVFGGVSERSNTFITISMSE